METMHVRTIRASRSRMQVEVSLGTAAVGETTVTVTLDRNKPEVREALRPFDTLAIATAQEHVSAAMQRVEQRVAELKGRTA